MSVANQIDYEELSDDVMRQAEAAGLGSQQFERAVRLGVRVEVVRNAVLWAAQLPAAPAWNMTLSPAEAGWLREVGFVEVDPHEAAELAAADLTALLED